MLYNLATLDIEGGIARHVWVGQERQPRWQGVYRFDRKRGKFHDQVRDYLATTLGMSPTDPQFPKIAVGTDAMWRSPNFFYERPPCVLS